MSLRIILCWLLLCSSAFSQLTVLDYQQARERARTTDTWVAYYSPQRHALDHVADALAKIGAKQAAAFVPANVTQPYARRMYPDGIVRLSQKIVPLQVAQAPATPAPVPRVNVAPAEMRLFAIGYDPAKPGTYTITITVAADGTITVRPAETLTPVYFLNAPQPPDPQPPDPPPPDGLGEKVREATFRVISDNKVAEQAGVAKLFESVAGLPLNGRRQFEIAINTLWNAIGLNNSWQTWKAEIDGLLAAVDEGQLKSAMLTIAGAVK